jgi:uncharacterized membrane protein YqjE
MPDTGGAAETGRRRLGSSLRNLAAGALGLFAAHVELLGVEIQEEKGRVAELAVLGACVLVLFGMALLLVSLLIVAALWDSYRLSAISGLAVAYVALGAYAIAGIRRKLAAHPNPFSATAAELDKDRERLRP